MISKVLHILERGLKLMRLHTHLFLVAVLVFVFPLIFILTSQSFFDTAYQNINTAQKQRIGALHDSVVLLIQAQHTNSFDISSALTKLTEDNPDVTEFQVVTDVEEGFLVVSSANKAERNQLTTYKSAYDLSLSDESKSLIFEYTESNVRHWQAVRKFEHLGQTYYVQSNHSFRAIDSIMTARRQDSYIWLSVIFAFLMGLAYWLARQIHWRKRAETLTKTLEERNMFTNMIAHEFRSPLSAINGYAGFLEDAKGVTSDERRYAQNIQTSVERLLLLVNDFLEVARIHSGKMSLKKKDTDVEKLIAQVVESMQPSATEKNLKLAYMGSKTPLRLNTDPNRLTQVLTNIISNSVKYTEQGAVIVSTENNILALTIRIEDTGTGISADDQKKLFAPFVRVGNVEKTSITGTGLGMWITKQLVELLGGTIGIESIKGVGTHVVLTFKH